MVIGVLIPDRGDRPKFLDHLFYMIRNQTLHPKHIEIVNYPPLSSDFDLTARIRTGFESLKNRGCDIVLIMENDDFYSSDYVSCMVYNWIQFDKPDIFGTSYTYYYHLFKKQFKRLEHPKRASLMNTILRTDIEINWPADNTVFLDLDLWKQLKGKTFEPLQIISIGIKHGVGLCGGAGHSRMLFDNNDTDSEFLRLNVDNKSFEFYTEMK